MDIKRLLRRKRFTGAEVGKVLIAGLLHDIKERGSSDYQPIIPPERFAEMERSLGNRPDELAVYWVYTDIFTLIQDLYNNAVQAQRQQFYHGYYQYHNFLLLADKEDEREKDGEKIPLIMTESQYAEAKRDAQICMRGYMMSFRTAAFSALSRFMEMIEGGKADAVPAEIRTAIEATKEEPVTNARILSHYNEDTGEGYYTLPDGRRSDSMGSGEWKRALEMQYLETHKLISEGKTEKLRETLRRFRQEGIKSEYKLFYEGEEAIAKAYKDKTGDDLPRIAPNQLLDALEALMNGNGKKNPLYRFLYPILEEEEPVQWHWKEDLPKGLTKYDILSDPNCLGRYSGKHEGDIPEKEQLSEFKKDYSSLYKALDAYLRECVPSARDLKATQLLKDTMSWGELADGGIISVTVTDSDIADYLQGKGELSYMNAQKARNNGIAVIGSPKSFDLDGNGHFINPEWEPGDDSLYGLSRLDSAHDVSPDYLYEMLIVPSIRYILACNALLDILSEIYSIDDIEKAYFNTDMLRSKAEAFNEYLHLFYFNVYGDKKEKAEKRKIIKEIFTPIDIDAQKPKAEAVETIKGLLNEAGTTVKARRLLHTANRDAIINALRSYTGDD